MTFSVPRKRTQFTAVALVAGLAWGAATVLNAPLNTGASATQALERARDTQITPAHGVTLPLPTIKNVANRKAQFILAMLPLIVRENDRLEKQRARAIREPVGSIYYSGLAYAYGLRPSVSRAVLLSHIDIVPVSLTLAQAAIESGWGTSRFAREGNAYFGERSYDPDVAGIVPGVPSPGEPAFKVKSFPDAQLSVRSFMKTLNTVRAYRTMRQQRATMRRAGQQPTGLVLALYLHGYSEIGSTYIERIIATINSNQLSAFNHIKIAP